MAMQTERSTIAPLSEWREFLQQCVSQRINAVEFKDLSVVMMRRYSISERKMIDTILESRAVTNVDWDPLIPVYVDNIHRFANVNIADILSSLLDHSSIFRHRDQAKSQNEGQAQDSEGDYTASTLMTDYRIIQNVMMAVTTGNGPRTAMCVVNTFSAIADWILALVSWNARADTEKGQNASLMGSQDAVAIFESIGFLFVALMGTEKSVNALSSLKPGAQRNKLARALTVYSPLCADVSIPLRNRLEALQKEFNLYTKDGKKSAQDGMMDDVNVSTLEFESNVVDAPAISSSAALYIYINALLVGRPLIDDNVLITYLNNRYGSHYITLVEEMITAAFDVLSNGMYRNESSKTMFLFRAFLVNKLPPFLADMSSSLVEPIPMELCITRALARVDPNTFPSFSQIFAMQGNSVLSDVRQEFLFSCALHKLIPESSIERLLGENPMQTLPVGGQYVKHELIAEINNNPERAEQLLNEIESMEGNAGAIVDAITEIIHSLCSRKDSMTLKNICNALSRRPKALDIMLLFKSPSVILQPLCLLLDEWKWDEEQGESQPVYDEFGSILLLVLAFKYKYDLAYPDLGISNPDSFVLRLLEKGASSQNLGNLTEKQNQNLGAWITALFIAEGISDESMSSCSPQEFYLLVTTLFSQSLEACEAGKLEFETLKGGFEYLLEPFLLPSLVMALTWLGKHIWESETDLTTSLRILYTLVNPSSISGEAQEIHRTILFITTPTLEDELKGIRDRHPSRTDIKPILDALEPYHSFQRTGAAHRSELEGWRANPAGGGMVTGIRNTFSSLVLWSTDPEISMTPPSYTHRQILAGIGHLGSVHVLGGLIDELKLQTETGSGDLAIDIAATLICAPMAESFSSEQAACRTIHDSSGSSPPKESIINPQCQILTLRNALSLQRESLAKIIQTDAHRAELIVRLHRRVEALSAAPQLAPAAHNLDVGNIMGDINLEGQHMELDGRGSEQHHSHNQQGVGGTGNIPGNFDAMLDAAASAAVAGTSAENANHLSPTHVGMGMDSSAFDDILNAADMGVSNPEYSDLDMEGML